MLFNGLLKNALIMFIACFMIFGCSTPATKNNAKHVADEDTVTISKEELAQLKASSQEWQQAKPGVERLLVIEEDLKQLISQLNTVVKPNTANEKPKTVAPTATPAKPQVVQQTKPKAQPLFALQVASVTERGRLAKSMKRIQAKAPALFAGKLAANVETVNVKGATYYRLKIGAYQYQKNATADCDKLKKQQINCIVSYYTNNPLTD